MKRKVKFLLGMLCILQVASSQQLPVILAQSNQVNIRDGQQMIEGAWTIVPEYRPDVYLSSAKGERVTFYTDLDSISFIVEPERVHNFIILLNGKDSAYTQIKYEASHLEKLKMAEQYQVEKERKVPLFTYQDADDPNLVALRRGFNLDSIAGTGNEVSQILNLMHWIHDLIPHDGSSNNPVIQNAMELIGICKAEERGLNCRGLAIVLNECYLAMGFQSRFVTCMPRDTVFQDCHVINTVYANDLQKWIWVDPTHDAYIMDETGTLLGLEEVREKLIKDEMIILNPDANWNHQASTLKENYLMHYMAKNLYRFSCVRHSQYDVETPKNGKHLEYIELLPLDGLNQLPKTVKEQSEQTGMIYTTYKTNDPNIFWAKPKNE
ncbi:MAG: transglutaminase domain-containing protein [Bacteroidota bacterium]